MKQKHFVDIEVLKENDEDIGGGLVRKSNAQGFCAGDIISITEKVDGSNASISYDKETKTLQAFSRKQPLAYDNTLDGFWNFVQTLDPNEFTDLDGKFCFGEWLRHNKISYNPENVHKWYVYSLYDVVNEKWLPRDEVIAFCKKHNLIYVHEFYYGPFISWEHCRSFCHSPFYGDTQEGVVVRNLSCLERKEKNPHILKIVNAEFKESTKTHLKLVDPEKEKAKTEALKMLSSIITRNRVEKMLLKLRDENILPEELTPAVMKTVAQNLPKRIYEDCVKEEPEIIAACGEFASKLSPNITMSLAREIIIGK